MSTRVIPTFLLKGLDPRKLLDDYRAGLFTTPRTDAKPIKVITKVNLLAPSYSSNRLERIYAIRGRHSNTIVIASSNYTNFSVTNVRDNVLIEGGRCAWCRSDIGGVPIGYPVDYQESVHLNPEGNTQIFYRFLVEDTFCDCECCLAYIRNHVMFSYSPLHLNAEIHLKMLYRLMYPGHPPLLAAKDPLLLESNGGSLEVKEWKDQSHAYLKSDRVLMSAARVEYVQQVK